MKGLQSLPQWLFMRVEALFNAAFGDRLNPLYHLGAISFFLFWIVAASGLYLYVFFKTGVADAYASVQALTDGQWFAGGIMRSVHRYASDAMVLTMLVHMLRHFAFDRFRGFRWFSWMTGVVLIWLVYISGINGYMLPWDKLAQFVVVASFEWLDWLPIFDGALIRNFIYQSSVNDRFFSLLSFIHVGLPLGVLLLMWIHVQRVPKASTNPPRIIMGCLLLTLLALALLRPALSQGGAADFGTAVTSTLAFDWFYLRCCRYKTGAAGRRLGAGRRWAPPCCCLALPWRPPNPAARQHQGRLHMGLHGPHGLQHRSGCAKEKRYWRRGLRAGLTLPYECRNGGCGVCMCRVEQGAVSTGLTRQRPARAPTAHGMALMCARRRRRLGDRRGGPRRRPVVTSGTPAASCPYRLSPDVMRMRIALPGSRTSSSRRSVHQHPAARRRPARLVVRPCAEPQPRDRTPRAPHPRRTIHRPCVRRHEGR